MFCCVAGVVVGCDCLRIAVVVDVIVVVAVADCVGGVDVGVWVVVVFGGCGGICVDVFDIKVFAVFLLSLALMM